MYSGLVTKSRVGIFVYNKIEPFFTFIQDEIVWYFSMLFLVKLFISEQT